jgi:hypothetical protein
MDNFDLKKYLVENKVTRNSRILDENTSLTNIKWDYPDVNDWDNIYYEPNRESDTFLVNIPITGVKSDGKPVKGIYVADLPDLSQETLDNLDIDPKFIEIIENKVTRNSRILAEQAGGYLYSIPLEDVREAPDIFGEVLIELFSEEDPSFKVPRGFFTDALLDQLIETAQDYKEGNISPTGAIKMLRKILTDPKNYEGDTKESGMVKDIEAEARAAAETFRDDVDENHAMMLGAEVVYDKYRQLRDNATDPGKVNTLKQKANIAYALMMSYDDKI